MLKAVIFDLDNTLLDFSGFKRESALAAARAMIRAGVKESEKELYARIFKIYDERGIEYQRTFGDVLYGISLDQHTLEHARQAAIVAYQKRKYDLLKPRTAALQTLISLKSKYKLAIVSDAPRDKAWQRLVLTNLDQFFYPVVTFNDTGEHKPSQKPFEKALKLLKIKADEALYVGDNPERDIVGAKKAGMTTCLAKYGCIGYMPELNVADYSIDRIDDLKGITEIIDGG
jgi:putative hydrolase of the HAD superfamily